MDQTAHRPRRDADDRPPRTSRETAALATYVHPVVTEIDFGEHEHPEHQLAWMREGHMRLSIGEERWTLHREHLVWLPGGVPHHVVLSGPGQMITAYAPAELRPRGARWDRPLVLAIDDLGAAALVALGEAAMSERRRSLCQALLFDLLDAAEERRDVLAVPRDPRARHVAEQLLAEPADRRELEDWARAAGVSAKTLARAFIADTGTTFGRWRTSVRMRAALALLAAGATVGEVAPQVGYDTPTGFIGAFRATFGTTPARYERERTRR